MSKEFKAAEKALETGTAADCRKAAQALEKLLAAEQARWAATAPPKPRSVMATDGKTVGQAMGDSGYAYREAALSDDPDALAQIQAEHARLDERRRAMTELRRRLENSAKERETAEKRDAAPAQAKAKARELDTALDALTAATEAYQSARADVERLAREVGSLRDLTDEAEPVSVETFARLASAMSHRLHEVPAFGSDEMALRAARRLLPAPPASLFERLRRKVAAITSINTDSYRNREVTPQRQAEEVTEFQRQRLALILRGDVSGAKQLTLGDTERAA